MPARVPDKETNVPNLGPTTVPAGFLDGLLDRHDAAMGECSRAILRARAWYWWNSLNQPAVGSRSPVPDTRYQYEQDP